MKKILLGLSIIVALSACTSSEEKIDIPTQVQTLNENVMKNSNTLTDIKSENEELKIQLKQSQKEAAIVIEQIKIIEAFEETGVTVAKVNNNLLLTLPEETAFKSSKSVLSEDMKEVLDQISETLMTYPNLDAVIKGHTDNIGPEEFNQKLSEERAIAVSTYLMDKGIESSRLEALGLGSYEPIDDNDTIEGQMANRRIDITISY